MIMTGIRICFIMGLIPPVLVSPCCIEMTALSYLHLWILIFREVVSLVLWIGQMSMGMVIWTFCLEGLLPCCEMTAIISTRISHLLISTRAFPVRLLILTRMLIRMYSLSV